MFDNQPWLELFEVVKKQRLILSQAGLIIGLALTTGCLVYLYLVVNQAPQPLAVTTSMARSFHSASATITVAITGAVKVPGVYKLREGALLLDLVRQAGGFNHQVNRLQVAQDLNLASKLVDGQQVFIPTLGSTPMSAINSQASGNNLISINTASAAELDVLAGIGQKRAQDIIDGRPYQSIDELVAKKILTVAQLEKIKAQLVL